MNFFEITFWQGFLGNLFATIIGVIIGIPIAFWINRRVEAETEKEKKKKILLLLQVELEKILDFVNNWLETMKAGKRILGISRISQANTIYDETWKALSDGGELQWIKDIDLLQQLASTYAQVSHVKFLSEKYMDVYFGMNLLNFFNLFTDIPKIANMMRGAMEELERSLVDSLNLINKNLK